MSNNDEPRLWDDSVPNQSPTLVIISALFLLISTAFFLARIIWRLKYKQKGYDDIMAFLAWTTLVVQTAFGGMAAHYGFGKHRTDILLTFSHAMFYFYLYQILYKVLGTFTKLTFCCLYLRLFKTHQTFKRLVWVTTAMIVAGGIAFTATTIWQCSPLERAWNRQVSGHCVENMGFWYSHASFNTIMDIVVFLLPIPLIHTLQMAKRTKKGLISLFLLGFFTIVASVVRLAMLSDSAKSITDPTWGSMKALIWTEIESNTSMICCCLPALRKLVSKLWRKATRTPSSSSSTPFKSGTAPTPVLDANPGSTSAPRLDPDRRSTFGKSSRHNNRDPQGFGNFTRIDVSPPRSPIIQPRRGKSQKSKPLAPDASSDGSKQTWLDHLLRSISPKKHKCKSSPPNEDGNAWLTEDRSILAPKIELGELYKDTGYRGDDTVMDHVPAWQPSSRMSVGGPPRDARAQVESTAEMANFLRGSRPDEGDACAVESGRRRV